MLVVVQSKLYIEDWIGLRKLDESGRVHFVSVSGGHLGISRKDMRKYVVPFLKDAAINVKARRIHTITHKVRTPLKLKVEKEPSKFHTTYIHRFFASIMAFMDDLI